MSAGIPRTLDKVREKLDAQRQELSEYGDSMPVSQYVDATHYVSDVSLLLSALDAARGREGENERLEAFLHAHWMHPDYEYETTDGPRKMWSEADCPPEGQGWERNIHVGRVGSRDAGWDRFDYHEESYWMRRIAGSGATDEGRE